MANMFSVIRPGSSSAKDSGWRKSEGWRDPLNSFIKNSAAHQSPTFAGAGQMYPDTSEVFPQRLGERRRIEPSFSRAHGNGGKKNNPGRRLEGKLWGRILTPVGGTAKQRTKNFSRACPPRESVSFHFPVAV
jgi:hypothetical protein